MNHRVHDFAVADAVAGARAGQQVGAVGHGLHAAGDDDFAFAKHNALRREGPRLREPGVRGEGPEREP
ncbi:hypothetical protein D3C83_31850 [compost metagenome]